MIYADPYASADVFEQDLMNIARDIELAEAEFRAALRDRVEVLAWRAPKGYERLSDYLANEARCADLVLTAVAAGGAPGASRSVNTGDLVMQIGRPVPSCPEATTQLKLDRVY